ncbi:MAG: hypothetical protein FD161_4810 [Limisphaerales bacterium]|nr:MAG: hypothetical protein FD161_4810 [Limisphaerales bacterium]
MGINTATPAVAPSAPSPQPSASQLRREIEACKTPDAQGRVPKYCPQTASKDGFPAYVEERSIDIGWELADIDGAVVIRHVRPDTCAERHGFTAGSTVERIGGERVRTLDGVERRLRNIAREMAGDAPGTAYVIVLRPEDSPPWPHEKRLSFDITVAELRSLPRVGDPEPTPVELPEGE